MPYRHLWPDRLDNNFSSLPHKRHDFRKKNVTEHKFVFGFPLQLLSEMSEILSKMYIGLHVK